MEHNRGVVWAVKWAWLAKKAGDVTFQKKNGRGPSRKRTIATREKKRTNPTARSALRVKGKKEKLDWRRENAGCARGKERNEVGLEMQLPRENKRKENLVRSNKTQSTRKVGEEVCRRAERELEGRFARKKDILRRDKEKGRRSGKEWAMKGQRKEAATKMINIADLGEERGGLGLLSGGINTSSAMK